MGLASVASKIAQDGNFGTIHEFLLSSQTVRDHETSLGFLSIVLVSWLVWRLLRFSIIPAFYPEDPKEVPYSVPLLGHIIDFFGNSNNLLTDSRYYFGNTREPFALTIAGMKTYVITSAEHVGAVYRNNQTLSYEEFVQAMMRILGNSEGSVKAMFTPLPKDKAGFANPHGKSLGILFREMHMHQLFPGPNLDFLERRFHDFFHENLTVGGLTKQGASYATGSDNSIVLPLTRWCSDYLVKGGQKAYFGPKLADIDPGLTDAFIIFDELSHQVIYQYPRFLAREMLASRDRVLRGLTQYMRLPRDERKEDAWFVGAMEDELRAIGMSDDDMAIASMTIYWAINTNTRKASYWLLAYLIQNPQLLERVREETNRAILPDGTVDLTRLHSSTTPLLDNAWKEMLRLAAFAASVRLITEDTVVGGKTLRKGNRLIIPYRQLHMDEAVYGKAVHEFRPERFEEKPQLAGSSNNSYRPFGGGSTMCPGRHVAKRAVYVFLALTLSRFDVEAVVIEEEEVNNNGNNATTTTTTQTAAVVGGVDAKNNSNSRRQQQQQPTLEPDLTRPVPGLMSPKPGEEMWVRLTERKEKKNKS